MRWSLRAGKTEDSKQGLEDWWAEELLSRSLFTRLMDPYRVPYSVSIDIPLRRSGESRPGEGSLSRSIATPLIIRYSLI